MPDAPRIYYPEDKLPLFRLLPMGLQHVVAMFGATVLAPLLMGFDPQVANDLVSVSCGYFRFLSSQQRTILSMPVRCLGGSSSAST